MTTKAIHNDIEAFIALKPINFRFLKSLCLKREIGKNACGRYDIEIIATSFTEDKTLCLRLFCTSAFGINLNDIEGGFGGLWIDIQDIQSHQIEGAKYKIFDCEHDELFSFYCKSFTAELIEQ
ncbi:MAG: hypothetical protein KDI65_12640 [Alphaproteobacteria bacterium]|nr:hypothetical protein [Alphaproteobacteria bacterium]